MYLARQITGNRFHYYIRETFRKGNLYVHRDLLDLGFMPQEYIKYEGGRNFYIDDRINDRLQAIGVDPDPFELEKLFFPFLDPEILYSINKFSDRKHHSNWKPLSADKRREIIKGTHVFDRRRAHFLRFGQSDQRNLDRPANLYRYLLEKSRDEIEQDFLIKENVLQPVEYKLYIFTIFNLQLYFSESFARSMPEALNEQEMDDYFLKQACKLDNDETFWAGLPRTESLPDYLVRYVIMYFDYMFTRGSAWEDYISQFMNSRRQYVPPTSGKKMTMSEISTVFGVTRAELSAMSRTELKKLFRKKATELHPDKGGEHDEFIELANAYNDIIRSKR